MGVAKILDLCNSRDSYIITDLGKDDLTALHAYFEISKSIYVDTSKYSKISFSKILSCLEPTDDQESIAKNIKEILLLTDIFSSFQNRKIELPFDENYLIEMKLLLEQPNIGNFKERYLRLSSLFNFQTLNDMCEFLRFKDYTFINVLINNNFSDIDMQYKLNCLINPNNPYKTRFFLEGNELITYYNSNGLFLYSGEDYIEKSYIKK